MTYTVEQLHQLAAIERQRLIGLIARGTSEREQHHWEMIARHAAAKGFEQSFGLVSLNDVKAALQQP